MNVPTQLELCMYDYLDSQLATCFLTFYCDPYSLLNFKFIFDNNYSIPMKPYIKGQYWMITTIPLDDNYQPGTVPLNLNLTRHACSNCTARHVSKNARNNVRVCTTDL